MGYLLEEGEGKGEESAEGKREWEKIVKRYQQIFIKTGDKVGGGRKGRKEIGTTQCY